MTHAIARPGRAAGALFAAVALAALVAAPAHAAPPPISFTDIPTTPGRYVRGTVHAGLVRTYRIAIPRGYDASRPAPLLFVFHGSGQTARSFSRKHPDLFTEADAAGFILVIPQGTDFGTGKPHWIQPQLDAFGVDDPGFILGLIDKLDAALAIDRTRVYAAGFSNGGTFSHYLGAAHPDVFAAITIVAGGVGHALNTVPPTAPVPVMLIYGRRDQSRPYDGGFNDQGLWVVPAADVADMWVRADGCDTRSSVRVGQGRTIERWTGCQGGTEVIFVTLDRMDHRWPDAADGFGFDANRRVIAFCSRHSN